MGHGLGLYVGRQLYLLEKFDKKKMEILGKCTGDNYLQWKEVIRDGIPDEYKRACILQYFGI
jgi:hypothetical protein